MSVQEQQRWKDQTGAVARVTHVTSDGEVGYVLEGVVYGPPSQGDVPRARHYQTVANFTAPRELIVDVVPDSSVIEPQATVDSEAETPVPVVRNKRAKK